MAKQRIKDPKAIACIVIASLCFSAIIILFTMGGIFFAEEHPKLLHYASSKCTVSSSAAKTYKCTTRYSQYTCYGATWEVYHGENKTIYAKVEEKRRFRLELDAIKRASEYKIGSSYFFWYDTRNPSVAQWDKPSTVVAIILLCCGGLSVLLTICFGFLSVKLVKQEILKRKNGAINPYFN